MTAFREARMIQLVFSTLKDLQTKRLGCTEQRYAGEVPRAEACRLDQ